MSLATETASPIPPFFHAREFLFVADVQAATGYSRASVWKWLKSGELVSYAFKGRRIIYKGDLDAFLKNTARAILVSEAA